eukprot:TRINITY_DN2186_c1_g1_i8.p1 TRINITY_DN2186_c1_g1~~TRINITY_DN2186_c1_g1_i8.p1  ORF type:complete len:106 (-),score=3.85 TRINITY_DN2186_c1_g1_i8:1876-2193(-)
MSFIHSSECLFLYKGRSSRVYQLLLFPSSYVVNSRASDYPREYDGACLQMRLAYSPAAHLFMFLVQWTDCSLAGALGLLRILIYRVNCWCLHCSLQMLTFISDHI